MGEVQFENLAKGVGETSLQFSCGPFWHECQWIFVSFCLQTPEVDNPFRVTLPQALMQNYFCKSPDLQLHKIVTAHLNYAKNNLQLTADIFVKQSSNTITSPFLFLIERRSKVPQPQGQKQSSNTIKSPFLFLIEDGKGQKQSSKTPGVEPNLQHHHLSLLGSDWRWQRGEAKFQNPRGRSKAPTPSNLPSCFWLKMAKRRSKVPKPQG